MKQSQINPDGTRPQQLSLWAGSLDHASHTQQPESDSAKKIIDISGRRCLESFARLSRPTSWAKTFSGLLIGQEGWYSRRCRLTWKLKGTKYNRSFFQLQVSAHRTEEIGFGLLLTPTTKEEPQDLDKFKARMEKYPNGTTMPNLATQVMGLLPTPLASDGTKISGSETENQMSLTKLATRDMLPTPATRDYKGARTSESLEAAGRNKTNSLPDAFSQVGMSSQLNPQFVAEMMGFPQDWLELPFLSTETNP